MNLNEIPLPAIAIEALYRKSLVDMPDASTTPPAQNISPDKPASFDPIDSENATSGIRYLGNNNKQITILVHYPEEPFIPENQLAFLGNILGACKLNIGDTAIVNTARQPVDFTGLQQELAPRQLILLGDHSAISDQDSFSIKETAGTQLLAAPPLETMNQETAPAKALKGSLWQCLKQLFNV